MITVLTGDNSFEIDRALKQIERDFNGDIEKIDGSDLQLNQLPDVLMGYSLFSTERTVVIKGLSDNKSIWPVFGDWILRLSSDINLILVEPKLDKRTSTFKALKDKATITEFVVWTDRDIDKAERWTTDEAKTLGIELDKKITRFLVERVGVDQWQLSHALQKLASVDEISIDVIKDVIEPNPIENVFNLFEAALRGDADELKQMIRTLELSEDAYRLFALLSSQAFQLAAIASAEKTDNVAKDFGIHPFVVSKLAPIARRIGDNGIVKIIAIFAQADDDMKISKAEPWLIIERALIKIVNI
jgi:DNA polymerase III delta subunit